MKVNMDGVISQQGQLTCSRSRVVRKAAHAANRITTEMSASVYKSEPPDRKTG